MSDTGIHSYALSPDGRRLAVVSQADNGQTRLSVKSALDRDWNAIAEGRSFESIGVEAVSPLWDRHSRKLYGVSTGSAGLLKIDVLSGHSKVVTNLPGYRIAGLIPLLANSDGKTLWVAAERPSDSTRRILKVDLDTGKIRPLVQEFSILETDIDANTVASEIGFLAADQHHLPEIWSLNTASEKTRRITHLNDPLYRYAMGSAHLIHW